MTRTPTSTALPALRGGEELRARITWSLISEPLDPMALVLRELLGPVDALRLARCGTQEELERILGAVELPADPTEKRTLSLRSRVERATSRWRARLEVLDLDDVRAAARRHRLRILAPGDPCWPARLDDLHERAPHCLWAAGEGDVEELLDGRSIAMVGARASTPYGEDTAHRFAAHFASTAGTVISGGAYGIDAAVHRGALAAQGPTVAILAGGLDAPYPRGNAELLGRIRRRGLLLAEVAPGTAPTRWRFLARNRLIAAAAQGTVVVEAAWRSGALSTARHADDLSRPVGAVPGQVDSAASAGCHRLIRERGAVLISDPSDLLDLLPGGAPSDGSAFAQADELDILTPADRRVLDAVPPRSSAATATIARDSGVPLQEAEAAVARMELLGILERAGQGVRRPQAPR